MKIKSIIILSALALLSLSSCRKEEIVRETVVFEEINKQTVLINVNAEDWQYTNMLDNNYFYAEVNMPEITSDILKTGLVKMYRVFNYNTKDESQMEMPCSIHYEEYSDTYDDWFFYTVSLDYEFYAGKLYINYSINNFSYELDETFVPGGMTFRCVVVE